jgi:hypothetical protein
MRHIRAAIAFSICVTVMGACGSGGQERRPTASPVWTPPRPTGSPVPGAVHGSAPYWCDLVSRQALTRMSGRSAHLSELRNSTASKDSTICGVRDKEKYGPLVVQWDITGGREEIAAWMKDVAADHPVALPARLGPGFIVYSRSASALPYFAASAFGCGRHDAWVELFVRGFSPGRDTTKDLTDLMRVAQRRLGVLHHCTPRPRAK